MAERVRDIKQVRKNRWERQRREAIMREQIATCYRQHTPAQIKEANRGSSRIHVDS